MGQCLGRRTLGQPDKEGESARCEDTLRPEVAVGNGPTLRKGGGHTAVT